MGQKKNSKKSSSFTKLVYMVGTAAFVVMLALSAINFARDAKVLKLPVLSKAVSVEKETKSSEPTDYETLKYKKSAPTATPKPKAKPSVKKTEATKPAATPKPSPTPQP